MPLEQFSKKINKMFNLLNLEKTLIEQKLIGKKMHLTVKANAQTINIYPEEKLQSVP